MPALIRDGAPVEIILGLPFVDAKDIQRPGNWLEHATASEKKTAGVVDIVEPPAPPAGKVIVPGPLGIKDGKVVRSYDTVDAPKPPVPIEISDRQFAQALAKMDVITKGEALAFVKRGEVPAKLQGAIDAIKDAETRFDVDMQVSGATIFHRDSASTKGLAASMQWSDAQLDDLWRFAASLP